MLLGIIADVHSNLPALESVLHALELEKIDKIIHGGDIVGYNPYPNEVIEILKERKVISILGNHDRAVLAQDTLGLNPYAAQAVLWTIDKLTSESYEYLRTLKAREKLNLGKQISIIHGSPWNDDEYVYEYELTPDFLTEVKAEVLIYGHTHVPCIKRFSNGLIINPGSVGQPRDCNPRASYAVLDLATEKADVKRVIYDTKAVMKKILKEGLPEFLAQRLVLGI
ncbi:MAG: metallophosphoesterase family protein [Candidatus Thermoplasmatota archaeon]|nr:metallophosphoesterase family protein [Candidatus Thermoplasmatota archaeon]